MFLEATLSTAGLLEICRQYIGAGCTRSALARQQSFEKVPSFSRDPHPRFSFGKYSFTLASSPVKEGVNKEWCWFGYLWPTAKKDNGEPEAKEGQCLKFNDISSCFHLHGGVDDHDVDGDGVDDDGQRDQVIPCSQELFWGDHAGLLKIIFRHHIIG